MSKTVDSRVVEMRFDNSQFESNVRTSMSTLERLKQSLNLTKSAKGLESVIAAAKKVDFSGMNSGIDSVNTRFSALQVMGVTALANITNSAVNAGKKIVSALTFEPVMTGFQEYETQINAIQTILSNTRQEGTNVQIVNKALDELNKYADMTIYNFTEMTRNIGTFTAAGVDLQTSVDSIKGIANLAAVSGSTSQQASTAMYQLSQALAAGKVQLMDWNSVVNAGMGGKLFQDALIRTSELLGTGAEAAIKAEGSFRESLTKTGWLTTEVLTETLKQLSGAYTEADLLAQGYTKSQAKEIVALADDAVSAAQDVKTFTQLWDTMKEAAQSGWAQTWRTVIGDFEEAKSLFTGISDFFIGDKGVITKMNDARNTLLESALGKSFSGLSKKLNSILEPATKVSSTVNEISGSLKDLGGVVDDVIVGKFGNGQKRFDALTKAGYNWCEVQNEVNKTLGNSHRYTKKQIEVQNKLLGSQKKTSEETKKTAKETVELTKEQKSQIKTQYRLYKEKSKDVKFTEQQVEAYKELEKTADQLGLSVDDLIDNINDLNGRWLLINSFKNIGNSLITIFESIGKAWQDVFKPLQSDQLFNGIASFHRITANALNAIKSNADQLTATFRGLFSAIHIITTLAGGGFTLAFRVISEVLGRFDMNILDLTAGIGNAITRLDQFITQNKLVSTAIDFIVEAITKAIDAVDKFIDSLVNRPEVQDFIEMMEELFGGLFGDVEGEEGAKNLSGGLREMNDALNESSGAAENFKTIFEGLNAVLDLGNYFITASLSSGIKLLNSVLTLFGTNLAGILTLMAEYVIKLRDWIKENTIFIGMTDKIAKVIVTIIKGIRQVVDAFMGLEVVQDTIQRFKDLFSDIFGNFEEGLDLSFIEKLCKNIEDVFNRISKWVESLKDSDNLGRDIVLGIANGIREGIGVVIDAISSIAETVIETFCSILGIHSPSRKGFEWGVAIVEGIVEGIKHMIGAVVGVVKMLGDSILDALKDVDVDFSVILDPIKEGLKKFIGLAKEFDYKKLLALIPIGIVLAFVKKIYDVAKILSEGVESINSVIKAFANVGNSLAGIADAYAQNIKAKALRNVAISLAILVGAVAMLTFVDQDKLYGSVVIVGILAAILVALAKAMDMMSSASGSFENGKINFDGIKTGLVQIGVTLLLLAATVRLIGTMNPQQAAQGFLGLAGLVIAVAAVFAAYGFLANKGKAAKHMDKVGSMLLKMSISMLILAKVCKTISEMSWPDMGKAAAFMAGFTIFVGLLVKATTIGKDKQIAKLGFLLLSISYALTMMVGVIKLVSLLDPGEILKGVAFVGAFVLFIGALVKVTTIGSEDKTAKIGFLVLSISVALMLMVAVVKLIGTLSVGEIAKGIVFVTAFGTLLAAFAMLVKYGGSQNMVKISATILSFSIAIGIMAGVATMLSLIPLDGLAKGVLAVAALGAVMTAMVWATRGANDIKGSITVMAVAIAIMAGAIATLSLIDGSRLSGATIALATIMGMFALMTKAAGMAKSSVKTIVLLGAMTSIVFALATILDRIQELPVASTMANAASISTLLLVMCGSLEILDGVKGVSKSAMLSLVGITAVVGGLSAILYLFKGMPVQSTLSTAASLSLLLLAMSETLEILDGVNTISSNAMKAMAALTVIVGALGVMLAVISKLNPGPTLEIAVSISTILLAMSGAALILSNIGPVAGAGVTAAAKFLGLVTVAGIILGAIGGLISLIPNAEKFLNDGIPIMESIGKNLGALIGGVIGGIGEAATGSLPQMGQDIAKFMKSLADASENASGVKTGSFEGVKELLVVLGQIGLESLGTSVIDVFTSMLGGGSSIEKFKTDAITFFSAMKDITEVTDGFTFDEESFNAVIKAGKSLTELQSTVEPMWGLVTVLTGRDDLSTFGNTVLAFINSMKTALGSLNEDFTFNEEALSAIITAGKNLSKLQSTIEPIGGLVNALTGWDDLGHFGGTVSSFISSMKTALASLDDDFTFNEEALNSIVNAGTRLSKLQSTVEPMWGLVTVLTGRDDLSTFGNTVLAFINSMKTALSGLNDDFTFNEEALNSIVNAGTRLSKLQSTVEPMWGLVTVLTGRDDLSTFGNTILAFINSMKTALGGLDDVEFNTENLGIIINAAKRLVGLSEVLPEEGWFDGKMNLAEFSAYIGSFATAMANFSNQTANINADGINVAITAANRIKTLINSLVGLDTSGVAAFTGIGTGGFGADGAVSDIGKAIASYSNSVAGIDTGVVNTSVSAALRLKTLIAGLAGLDASGIENFKIGSVGTQMKNYAAKVAGIDTGVVSSSISSANRLKTFIAGLTGLDSSGISNFKVGSIGTTLKSYASSVTGMNTSAVSSSISVATRLKNFISSLSGFDGGGVSSYVSAINKLGTVSVDGIVKSFSGASTKMLSSGSNLIESVVKGMRSKQSSLTSTVNNLVNIMQKAFTSKASAFQTAGAMLMTKLVTGIKSKASSVSSTMKSAVSSAASSIRGQYSSMYSAGSYLGSGLVSGINSKQTAAYNAGYALGQAAVQGEKDGQASNSPSKLTIQAGKWLGEGLIIGIEKMGSKVYNAGHSLGDSAASSMSTSISRIADAINTDIDAQPTIRPVLDLDNIKSGAGMINGMLSQNTSVGVNANLNAISTMMNQNGYQTGMDDVVYAINKLRKDLGDVGNTSYNINGLTYDDGSNISDAVKSIVRAARVERRI